MPWPSDQDYNEAIQNPRVAFTDAELQSGQIELNAMGLPKARSGNFATVYKVVTNGTVHAVRCFRYDNPEHSIRYPAVASHLTQHRLPYMVSFRYMSQGIRAGAGWYPILKMRWVEGDSLIGYVEKNLSSPASLQRLAKAWEQMMGDLQRANVAHGDLQHGNVLVVQGELKLVDYDGMYVPALAGSRGIELGHRNYQHPERTELDFGLYLDNFSAWLIYLSILALAVRPTLWNELRAGDECLLFRKQDLATPDHSDAFRLLKAVPDQHVQRIADRIEDFLWLPLDQIPCVAEAAVAGGTGAPAQSSAVSGGSWILDHLGQSSTASTGPAAETDDDPILITNGDTGWIQDLVDEPTVVGTFTSNVWVERLIGLALLFSNAVLIPWLIRGWGVGVGLVISAISIAASGGIAISVSRFRYRRESVYTKVNEVRSEFAEANREVEVARSALDALRTTRQRRRESHSAETGRLQGQRSTLQSQESNELNGFDAGLRARLLEINNRRRALSAEEGAEKRKIADNVGSRITRLAHQLASLPDQERQELARLDATIGASIRSLESQGQQAIARRDADLKQALREYQDQVVNGHLHRYRISEASVQGIGPELKRRLAMAGFNSAGDIGTRFVDVPGIGAKKWDALRAWRRSLEGPIRTREAPKSLPTHKSASIEQRHEGQIKQLQQNLAQEQARLTSATEGVRRRHADQKRQLEQERSSAENDLRQQTAALERRLDDARKQMSNLEQQARATAEAGAEECRKRYQAATSLVLTAADQVREVYRVDIERLNKELETGAKRVRTASWRRDHVQRKWAAYAPLTFSRYAQRVLGRA